MSSAQAQQTVMSAFKATSWSTEPVFSARSRDAGGAWRVMSVESATLGSSSPTEPVRNALLAVRCAKTKPAALDVSRISLLLSKVV